MTSAPHDLNKSIKQEAGTILNEAGLLAILNEFGTVHISGSYALDLMTWRDLDIYVETEKITLADFFLLGGDIAGALQPAKMNFRNERIAATPGLPSGLYWGVYLGDERKGAWKIDIWAVGGNECKRLLDHCAAIKRKLTPESAQQILAIKSQCWQDPSYRKSYSSGDIYRAVLENGVKDIEQLKKYLRTKG
jgi:hypothetical protein